MLENRPVKVTLSASIDTFPAFPSPNVELLPMDPPLRRTMSVALTATVPPSPRPRVLLLINVRGPSRITLSASTMTLPASPSKKVPLLIVPRSKISSSPTSITTDPPSPRKLKFDFLHRQFVHCFFPLIKRRSAVIATDPAFPSPKVELWILAPSMSSTSVAWIRQNQRCRSQKEQRYFGSRFVDPSWQSDLRQSKSDPRCQN